MPRKTGAKSCLGRVFKFKLLAKYLTGENLKVVWAEFSTLSWAFSFQSDVTGRHEHNPFVS